MYKYANIIFHDSTHGKYRRPLGAVAPGQEVTLNLYIKDVYVDNAFLRVFHNSGSAEYRMEYSDGWWSARVIMPEEPGLVWYYFTIDIGQDRVFYGSSSRFHSGLGSIYSSNPASFQITVCDAEFKTPDFFKKAVAYQIFPDRFRKSSLESGKAGVEYHRSLGQKAIYHSDFRDDILYEPQEGEQFYTPCDYYGGDLKGIEQSLIDLASAGVRVIYLNPIFEADSNHRYNTSDYCKIDPVLGTEDDLKSLCAKAQELDIKIILDGVFSHTGDDSVYFNSRGSYDSVGAAQSKDSPYYSWYSFSSFPDEYRCWWGFKTLPEVDEHNPDWQKFVITGEDSVINRWLRAGASGYRLDVADELPDDVIELMRTAIKKQNSENLLIGEVWEDPTSKTSYNNPRRYALGRGLDSVMNYPLRSAIIDFLIGETDARELTMLLSHQATCYPKEMYYCLMNLLSSHDVERIRTVLSLGKDALLPRTREEQADMRVSADQDAKGALLQRIAVALVFSIPGMPTVYYGDEVGMHGLKDPFNRRPYIPRDRLIKFFYKSVAAVRNKCDALETGFVSFRAVNEDVLAVLRFIIGGKDAFGKDADDGVYITVINRANRNVRSVIDIRAFKACLSEEQYDALSAVTYTKASCLLTGRSFEITDGLIDLEVFKMSAMILRVNYR